MTLVIVYARCVGMVPCPIIKGLYIQKEKEKEKEKGRVLEGSCTAMHETSLETFYKPEWLSRALLLLDFYTAISRFYVSPPKSRKLRSSTKHFCFRLYSHLLWSCVW